MTKLSGSPRNPSSQQSTSQSQSSSASAAVTAGLDNCTVISQFRSRIDGVCAYYISTEEGYHVAIDLLQQYFSGYNSNIISLDLEGVHLSKHGPISLLHMYDGKATFIFDVLQLKDFLFKEDSFIRVLLTSTVVTKVMFDCRKDCEALYHQFGVKLDNVIDVQMAEIMYRYKLIKEVPKYFIGLTSAVEQYNILKGTESFEIYSGVRTTAIGKYSPVRGGRMEIWGDRPLDMDLLLYCAEDIKSIYRLYTKVFSKKLSYEVCIGASLTRLRKIFEPTPAEASEDLALKNPDGSICAINRAKCLVDFDVPLYTKFDESIAQYKKMRYIVR